MKKLFLFLFLILAVPLALAAPVFAQNNNQRTIILPEGQTVNNDYFAAGDNVIISGTVNGDAYLAGGNITVDGTINGDLLAAGGAITIRGNVTNNVRVVGGSIRILSDIGRNVSVAGGDIIVNNSAKISGSFTSAGGRIEIYGPVEKGITIAGGQATVGSSVNGNITAAVSNLILSKDAKVNGNLTYISQNKAEISPNASVSGQIKQQIPEEKQPTPKGVANFFAGLYTGFKIISLIAGILVGLLLLRFLPAFTQRSIDTINSKFWKSMLVGFLAFILTPIIGIILFITLIGIPLAFILFFTFFLVMYLASILIAYALGIKIMQLINRNLSKWIVLIIGLIIYTIITSIPILGGIINILALFVGVGAILIEELAFYNLLRSKKLL